MNFNKFFLIIFLLLFNLLYANTETQTITSGNISITADKKDLKFAQKIIDEMIFDIDFFQRKIGNYPDLPVKIVIACDEEDYLTKANTKSDIIEFSQAFYSRRNKTIYIKEPTEHRSFVKLRKILLHEYIHHFVWFYWKNPPLWFNEGMAVYFSNDLSLDREFNFIKNYILGNSLSLEQMKYRYPGNRIEWESFYAKSAMAVKYLFTKREKEFYKLWDNALPSRDFNKIFLKSFLFTPQGFSKLFEEYCKSHFKIEILLASTGIIWGILPLVLMIAWIRKQFINRKIRRKWEMETDLKQDEGEIISNPEEIN